MPLTHIPVELITPEPLVGDSPPIHYTGTIAKGEDTITVDNDLPENQSNVLVFLSGVFQDSVKSMEGKAIVLDEKVPEDMTYSVVVGATYTKPKFQSAAQS